MANSLTVSGRISSTIVRDEHRPKNTKDFLEHRAHFGGSSAAGDCKEFAQQTRRILQNRGHRLPGTFTFIKPHPFDEDLYLATHLSQFQELFDNKQRAVLVLEMTFELLGDA
jgi:hypothetical protein